MHPEIRLCKAERNAGGDEDGEPKAHGSKLGGVVEEMCTGCPRLGGGFWDAFAIFCEVRKHVAMVMVGFSEPVGVEYIDLGDCLQEEMRRKIDLVSRNGTRSNYF